MDYQSIPSEILSLKFTGPVQMITNEKGASTNNGKGSNRMAANRVARSSDDEDDVLVALGVAYTTTATAFGTENVPVQGVANSDGSHTAVLDLSSKTINLSDLIDKLLPEVGSLFVFDDAKIGIDQDTKRITFAGTLRLDGAVLGAFKSFMKMDTGPLITASIDAEGQDLSVKIRPSNIVFSCAYPAYLQLASNVTLSDAFFQLHLKKVTDTAANSSSWIIEPITKGTLTITNIASTPVEMIAEVSYGTDGLSVLASVDKADQILNINNLNLKDLKVSFQTGNAASIDLSASFSAGALIFDFAGKVTPDFIGLTASAGSFTSDDLSSLFSTLSGSALNMPSYNVDFENVMLCIASAAGTVGSTALEAGVKIACHLTVHGNTCEASAVLEPDFVMFKGSVDNVQVGPINLDQVSLNMQYATLGSAKTTKFALLGKMTVRNLQLSGKIAYEKTGSDWNRVVYASLQSDTFRLSTLFPETANTFPDSLRFSKAAIIYSSSDGTTQDPDFGFAVKQGLQLSGILEEVSALSTLIKNKSIGLQLTALMNGTTTSIGIAMPESTRLSLGRGVTCDPFAIAVQLTPQPELDLIFGIDVQVANQQQPLHFDFKLGLNLMGASGSGTMKGYWKNPFGLIGLQIGPELALEADIIYAQFLSTGTPSGFGFAGGIMLGDIVGKMALSIAEDPTGEILYGEVENLSPLNLVKFASGISKINIPTASIPDFFELKQLKLYCAPTGGSIGTITYPQGFSFACNMVLFEKQFAIFATVNDSGVIANGYMDTLELGPLKVTGENGQNVQMGLELSTEKQSVMVDGAIDFFGARTGVFVDVSKQGVNFKLEQSFADLLKYSIAGKSTGSFSSPSTMDFDLTAVFDSSITEYLRTTVTARIGDALKQTNKSIDDLQAALDATKAAYDKVYNPAFDELIKARESAKAYLKQCQQNVDDAQKDWDKKTKDAQSKLAAARSAYEDAFKKAQDAYTQAQSDYNQAFELAQQKVTSTKTAYDYAFNKASQDLDNAQRNYDNKISAAKNNVNDAKRKVDSLQNQINDAQRDYDSINKLKHPIDKATAGAKLSGLKIEKETAGCMLDLANNFLDGFKNTSEAVALGTAQKAVQTANTVTKGYYDTAILALNALQTTGKAPLNLAKNTVDDVLNGAEKASLGLATKVLEDVAVAGKALMNTANDAIDKIGNSSAYVGLMAAEEFLEKVKHGTESVAFDLATDVLQGAKLGADGILKLSSYIASRSGNIIIDVKHIDLSAKLSGIKKGASLKANINVLVLGQPYQWSTDYSVTDPKKLVETIFQETFNQAKRIAGM